MFLVLCCCCWRFYPTAVLSIRTRIPLELSNCEFLCVSFVWNLLRGWSCSEKLQATFLELRWLSICSSLEMVHFLYTMYGWLGAHVAVWMTLVGWFYSQEEHLQCFVENVGHENQSCHGLSLQWRSSRCNTSSFHWVQASMSSPPKKSSHTKVLCALLRINYVLTGWIPRGVSPSLSLVKQSFHKAALKIWKFCSLFLQKVNSTSMQKCLY